MLDYRAISRRHALIPDDLDEDHTLDQILALMLSATPTDMASIMLITHDRAEPRAATHALARQADQAQITLHNGPGLSGDHAYQIHRIDHTIADTRWPHWGTAVARLGIGSVLCLPMTAPDQRAIGSITLYAYRHAAFAPTDVEVAAVLARHATTAYLNAHHTTAPHPAPGVPAPRATPPTLWPSRHDNRADSRMIACVSVDTGPPPTPSRASTSNPRRAVALPADPHEIFQGASARPY